MGKSTSHVSVRLGLEIKKRRQAKGWTQSVLAEKCNLTDGSIKMIETGRRYPRPTTLESIANALDCPISLLLSELAPNPSVSHANVNSRVEDRNKLLSQFLEENEVLREENKLLAKENLRLQDEIRGLHQKIANYNARVESLSKLLLESKRLRSRLDKSTRK